MAPGRTTPTSQARRPPSVGAAVATFAVGGLAAVLVLAAVGLWGLARLGRDEAVDDAKELTALVGRDVVEPELDAGLLRGDPAAVARVDAAVRRRVLGGDFIRVKIW